MITTQDAIERARLASDDTGLLSQYTYNQILDQLEEHEKYAFTMALVDLGIQTKYGSREVEVQAVLDEEISDIAELFQKASQTFKQSPGGIWAPDTWMEDEEAPEPVEAPEAQENEPFYGTQDDPKEAPQDIANTDLYDTAKYIEILTNAGIHVDSEGMVTFYKTNIPGVFSDQIPMKPIPMEKAMKMLEQNAGMVDKEQTRVQTLQDVLAGLNNDFTGLGDSVEDMVANFDDVLGLLEKFKYSEKSPNQDVASIAEGLTTIRNYLEETGPELEDLQYGIGEHSGVIGDMQGKLDWYYQSQYDKSGEKGDLVEAMGVIQYMQEENPEVFNQAINQMGGIAASFYS